MHNKLHCLFVDPMPGFEFLTRANIEFNEWPIEIEYVNSPLDALAYLRSKSVDDFPDAILSDWRPFFNGVEMAYRIFQEFGKLHPKTLFYICTCPNDQLDRQQFEQLPLVTAVLPKPFDNGCFGRLWTDAKQAKASPQHLAMSL